MELGEIHSRSYGILSYPSSIIFKNYGKAVKIATQSGGDIKV